MSKTEEIDVEKVIANAERVANGQTIVGVDPVWCEPLRDLCTVVRALNARLLALETAPGPAKGKPAK